MIVRDITPARLKRQLAKWGYPLGSLAKYARAPSDVGRVMTWSIGSIMVCSHCTKVVGYHDTKLEVLLDPNAGWVLERRRFVAIYFACGHGGAAPCEHCGQATSCGPFRQYENPLACSDQCETELLKDRRFEHCEPPFGYQRGGPHP